MLLVIYLPDLGHGFIKDDFVWIESNQARSLTDLLAPFTEAPDFYRPLVSLSFAADWWLFGAEPLGYGLTNLAFLLAAAAILASLAARLGLPRGAAVLVAVATVPLHWSRNARWVAPAELSAHVLDAIAPVVAVLPPDGVLISVPVAP